MYRLTSSLPYLLNRVGVRMGELFSRELEGHDLTLPMYRVLAALNEQSDQRLTDLSAMTGIEMTTLSRLVASMQKRRLLVRQRPEDNLRTVRIELTPEGRILTARLIPRAQHYEAVAMQGLAAGDVDILKATLARIYSNLDEIDIVLEKGQVPPGSQVSPAEIDSPRQAAGARR